jgi:hypothetical protein
MFNRIGYLFYKTLCLFFYYIGDILSRLPFSWSADMYQYAMKLSVEFDDKIGREIWKEVNSD